MILSVDDAPTHWTVTRCEVGVYLNVHVPESNGGKGYQNSFCAEIAFSVKLKGISNFGDMTWFGGVEL